MARAIPIRGETITLGQLLKLAGVVDSGSEAKALLASEPGSVNEQPEARRGRQLRHGDVVRIGDHELCVSAAQPPVQPNTGQPDTAQPPARHE